MNLAAFVAVAASFSWIVTKIKDLAKGSKGSDEMEKIDRGTKQCFLQENFPKRT